MSRQKIEEGKSVINGKKFSPPISVAQEIDESFQPWNHPRK